jgi:hypothetical protein
LANTLLENAPNILKPTASDILKELEGKITQTYSGELWQATLAALAVLASLSLKARSNPLTLIFEGASGRGKSTVINMFAPDRNETRKYLYRLDKFTPASFVTQAASIAKEDLDGIDLLPKIKDKLLVTKELAPLFRGREDALRETFGTLAAVLDGKGHKTASGVHGTRGYDENHVFNWIGGTTPIPPQTDAIMAQLGNRLLRYEIVGEKQSEEELLKFLQTYKAATIEDECKALANSLVELHFEANPVSSVEQESISFPTELMIDLLRLSKLVAQARVEVGRVKIENDVEYCAGEPEGPHRVGVLLRTYALGYALMIGKPEVDAEVLESVRHLAFSSIPRNRRKLLRALLLSGGRIETGKR